MWSDQMSRDEARKTLDLARAGGPVPLHAITEALLETGDLTPFRQAEERILEGYVEARLALESKWGAEMRIA